jgi:prolipoprotein diacylglyceryltransferase
MAYFIGFRYFLYLRRKKGDPIPSSNRVWILIAAIFGGLFGSRLIGGLEDPSQIAIADNVLFYFYQNKTVLGGFLGSLFFVELVKKRIGERQASGDLFVYPVILALMIGRAGCFSMGVYEETYGVATSLPWGMPLGDGIIRHPVALYEIVFLLSLWIVLVRLEKKYSLANGARYKLFMLFAVPFPARFYQTALSGYFRFIYDPAGLPGRVVLLLPLYPAS